MRVRWRSGFHLFWLLAGNYSGIFSGNLSDTPSGTLIICHLFSCILSNILSGICSDILCGNLSGILSDSYDRVQAWPTAFGASEERSSPSGQTREAGVSRSEAHLRENLKTFNDPHLASGDLSMCLKHFMVPFIRNLDAHSSKAQGGSTTAARMASQLRGQGWS